MEMEYNEIVEKLAGEILTQATEEKVATEVDEEFDPVADKLAELTGGDIEKEAEENGNGGDVISHKMRNGAAIGAVAGAASGAAGGKKLLNIIGPTKNKTARAVVLGGSAVLGAAEGSALGAGIGRLAYSKKQNEQVRENVKAQKIASIFGEDAANAYLEKKAEEDQFEGVQETIDGINSVKLAAQDSYNKAEIIKEACNQVLSGIGYSDNQEENEKTASEIGVDKYNATIEKVAEYLDEVEAMQEAAKQVFAEADEAAMEIIASLDEAGIFEEEIEE